jgi:hypothetical protein
VKILNGTLDEYDDENNDNLGKMPSIMESGVDYGDDQRVPLNPKEEEGDAAANMAALAQANQSPEVEQKIKWRYNSDANNLIIIKCKELICDILITISNIEAEMLIGLFLTKFKNQYHNDHIESSQADGPGVDELTVPMMGGHQRGRSINDQTNMPLVQGDSNDQQRRAEANKAKGENAIIWIRQILGSNEGLLESS